MNQLNQQSQQLVIEYTNKAWQGKEKRTNKPRVKTEREHRTTSHYSFSGVKLSDSYAGAF